MMTRAMSEEGFTGDSRGLVQTYTIPCRLNPRKCPPCRETRDKGGATVVKNALKSSSCGSEPTRSSVAFLGSLTPGPNSRRKARGLYSQHSREDFERCVAASWL